MLALTGVFGRQRQVERDRRPFLIENIRWLRFTGSAHPLQPSIIR
jgi:hypothetical protein